MTSGARLLGRHKAVWLAIAAIAVAGIAAAAVPPPSGLADTETGAPSTFAAMASGAIVALSVLPFIVLRGSGRRPIWIDCTKANPLVDPFEKLKSTLGDPLASARIGVRLNAELAKPAE